MGWYVLLVIVIVFLRLHLTRENRKKDELASGGIQEANDNKYVHAFDDLTDGANPIFDPFIEVQEGRAGLQSQFEALA